MPKTRGEDDKKHGDKLHSLIERTGGNPSSRKRTESAADDEPALVRDDDDPALLEDDDDEDVLSDDIGADREVDERE